MPVLKYWSGTEWISIGAGAAWSPGDVKTTFRTTAETGWLMCDGSLVQQADYPALFAAIGHSANGGSDPGGGNFKVPDLRERFPIGKGAGVALFESGGSNNAVTVSHNHTQDAHSHTQDAHGHTGTATAIADHQHAVDGDTGFRYAATVVSSTHRLSTTGNDQALDFTDTDPAGGHGHTLSVNSQTATNQNGTATNQPAGSSGTNANRPAFVGVNYVIKT